MSFMQKFHELMRAQIAARQAGTWVPPAVVAPAPIVTANSAPPVAQAANVIFKKGLFGRLVEQARAKQEAEKAAAAVPITQGTGEVARPLPIRSPFFTRGPAIFRGAISPKVANLPTSGSTVPGIRGGFALHPKVVLLMRQILQQKMTQGIPFYMAQDYAMKEAQRQVETGEAK